MRRYPSGFWSHRQTSDAACLWGGRWVQAGGGAVKYNAGTVRAEALWWPAGQVSTLGLDIIVQEDVVCDVQEVQACPKDSGHAD